MTKVFFLPAWEHQPALVFFCAFLSYGKTNPPPPFLILHHTLPVRKTQNSHHVFHSPVHLPLLICHWHSLGEIFLSFVLCAKWRVILVLIACFRYPCVLEQINLRGRRWRSYHYLIVVGPSWRWKPIFLSWILQRRPRVYQCTLPLPQMQSSLALGNSTHFSSLTTQGSPSNGVVESQIMAFLKTWKTPIQSTPTATNHCPACCCVCRVEVTHQVHMVSSSTEIHISPQMFSHFIPVFSSEWRWSPWPKWPACSFPHKHQTV